MDDVSIGGDAPVVETKDGTIYVPEKKKTHLFMALLLIGAGIFLLVGISSLGMIIGLVQGIIMAWLSSLTGWDPILSSLFIGVVGLFIATLLYVIARRESEVARKIEMMLKLNVTNEPTEYYALDLIPHEELLHEFKKRGCAVSTSDGEERGVTITCDRMPHSKRIMGVMHPHIVTLSRIQRFSVIAVILVLWSVYLGTLLYGVLTDSLVWIVAVAIMVLSALLLMGTKMIRLWHTIILWTAVNIIFTLFVPLEPTTVWSLWGAEAVYIVLVSISYLLYQGQCEVNDRWYCEVM